MRLLALYEECEQTLRRPFLARLLELRPEGFEQYARRPLGANGFAEMVVNGRTGDGGIDGYGKLKVRLAMTDVAPVGAT